MLKKAGTMIICALLATALLSGCTIDINGDRVDLNGNISVISGTTLEETQQLQNSSDGLKSLNVTNTAGNVTVTGTGSGDISINVTKKVKGSDEKVKKEIMDNIDIKVEKSGDRLTVRARAKDGSDLWNKVRELYKGVNVSIDYDIKVPSSIKNYDIRNTAGNARLDSVNGEMKVDLMAGNLDLGNVSPQGNSSFTVNAGNITFDAADINGASEINLKGTAGNASITLPEKSAFSLEAGVTAGVLSGSFLNGTRLNMGKLNQEFNGGGTKLKVTFTAGNVTINRK